VNKKAILIVAIMVLCIIWVAWHSYSNQTQNVPVSKTSTLTETPASTITSEPTDFTASFEIYTNGTRRIFTAAMYHNQAVHVFIQNPDPSIVYVKESGITWTDFFSTLPFSLTKDCLVTGTKETYCNGEKKLRFFLNDFEAPDALDLAIQPGDSLRVTYGE